jgi:hypothetical protein
LILLGLQGSDAAEFNELYPADAAPGRAFYGPATSAAAASKQAANFVRFRTVI